MKPEKMKCEACRKTEHQWVLTDTMDESVSYFVCSCCLARLNNYDLTKKQFRNLIKAGHTQDEFLLHDDFYDEDGEAMQPQAPDKDGIQSFR
jgi:hypothetical protein